MSNKVSQVKFVVSVVYFISFILIALKNRMPKSILNKLILLAFHLILKFLVGNKGLHRKNSI